MSSVHTYGKILIAYTLVAIKKTLNPTRIRPAGLLDVHFGYLANHKECILRSLIIAFVWFSLKTLRSDGPLDWDLWAMTWWWWWPIDWDWWTKCHKWASMSDQWPGNEPQMKTRETDWELHIRNDEHDKISDWWWPMRPFFNRDFLFSRLQAKIFCSQVSFCPVTRGNQ